MYSCTHPRWNSDIFRQPHHGDHANKTSSHFTKITGTHKPFRWCIHEGTCVVILQSMQFGQKRGIFMSILGYVRPYQTAGIYCAVMAPCFRINRGRCTARGKPHDGSGEKKVLTISWQQYTFYVGSTVPETGLLHWVCVNNGKAGLILHLILYWRYFIPRVATNSASTCLSRPTLSS